MLFSELSLGPIRFVSDERSISAVFSNEGRVGRESCRRLTASPTKLRGTVVKCRRWCDLPAGGGMTCRQKTEQASNPASRQATNSSSCKQYPIPKGPSCDANTEFRTRLWINIKLTAWQRACNEGATMERVTIHDSRFTNHESRITNGTRFIVLFQSCPFY